MVPSATTATGAQQGGYFQLNAFLKALSDSLSFHRTLRLLVNNSNVALITAKILATNGLLLIGSHFLFHRGILPLVHLINDRDSFFASNTHLITFTDSIIWLIFKALWLFPICILCYVGSLIWYQELADHTYSYLKGTQKVSIAKKAGSALYGTLIWLFIYVEVQLLTVLTPTIFNNIHPYVELFFSRIDSSYPYLTPLNSILRQISFTSVSTMSFLLQSYGYLLMCLLYGWYAFDPQWIAANVDPDTRCGLLERHWAYFVGFGFPYVLLVKNTSFFVGFGTFLALFPFCIMLGSLSDFTAPYYSSDSISTDEGKDTNNKVKDKEKVGDEKVGEGKKVLSSRGPAGRPALISLPLFANSKRWTLWTLTLIDQKNVEKPKEKKN